MNCKQCGKELPENARFCNGCGSAVAAPAPEQTAPPESAANVCPVCGAALNPGAVFCKRCGKAVEAPQTVPPPQPIQQLPQAAHEPPVQPTYPARQQTPAYTPRAAALPKKRRGRPILISGIALLLVVALVVTGLWVPGWFSILGGSGSRGGSDGDESDRVVENVPDPFAGHSAAFSVTPAEGVTISAEENALDRDRTFTVTDPSEEEYDAICTGFESIGVIPWRVYEVDAGLSEDESFPGEFQMDFDLRALDVPQDAYATTVAWRVSGDGSITELVSEIQGGTLVAKSSQNSFIVVGAVVIKWTAGATFAAVASFFGPNAIMDYSEKWDKIDSEFMLSKPSANGKYKVYYDASYSEDGAKLAKKVQDAHKAAVAQAEKEINESGAYNNALARWLARANKTWAYSKSYDVEQAYYQLTNPNSEFRLDPNNTPKAVDLIIAYLDECHNYLWLDKKLKPRTNVTDVLLCKNLGSAYGNQVKPTGGNPYILLNNNKINVNDANSRSDLKLTIVHELAHVFQTNYTFVDWNSNIVMWETTALVIESQARDEMSLETRPQLTEHDYYETLSVTMGSMGGDVRKFTSDADKKGTLFKLREQSGIANGYTLGGFLLYLEETLGSKADVSKILGAFKWGKSFVTCIASGFGLSAGEIPDHFYAFCKNKAAGFLLQHKKAVDSGAGYPDLTYQPVALSMDRQSAAVYVLSTQPMSAYVREFKTNRNSVGGQYALLICADPDDVTLADWQWSAMRLSPNSVKTPKGVFYKVRRDPSIYMLEVNYFLRDKLTGNGRYQAVLFVPPEYPRVSFSDDNKNMIITLADDDSEAARLGKIDGYRVTIESSDGKKTTQHISADRSGQPLNLPVAGLTNQRLSADGESSLEAVDWDVDVCQYIQVRPGQFVYGPESSGGGGGLSESELDESLLDANAQSGLITVSLGWQTSDDVDLHVITPTGSEIYYSSRSHDSGTLDVDANASSDNIVSNPVENIFFTDPPSGTYKVSVVMYSNRNEGAAAAFIVRVKVGEDTKVFRGTIASGSQHIYTFTYGESDTPGISDIPNTEAPADQY